MPLELADDIALERPVPRRAGKAGTDLALALEIDECRIRIEAGRGAPVASGTRRGRKAEQRGDSKSGSRDVPAS